MCRHACTENVYCLRLIAVRQSVDARRVRAERRDHRVAHRAGRDPRATGFGDVDSVQIPGIPIQPSPDLCVRSVASFLTRLLLPRDICAWRQTNPQSPLTEQQQAALVLPARPTSSSYVDRSIYGRP